jgi:hypothetical protein
MSDQTAINPDAQLDRRTSLVSRKARERTFHRCMKVKLKPHEVDCKWTRQFAQGAKL